jgi:hypothetical protein
MKKTILLLSLFATTYLSAQDTSKTTTKPEIIKKADNYTIQRLIVFNTQNEILLEKGRNGWMTPSLRSNENQTLREGLDSLAKAIGISVKILKLSGLYTYKFKDLPDHKEVSYRTHYTAEYISGELIQPTQPDKEYKWIKVNDAIESISNTALKAETNQIIKFPNTLWGGSFLYTYKDGKLESIKMTEDFYSL